MLFISSSGDASQQIIAVFVIWICRLGVANSFDCSPCVCSERVLHGYVRPWCAPSAIWDSQGIAHVWVTARVVTTFQLAFQSIENPVALGAQCRKIPTTTASRKREHYINNNDNCVRRTLTLKVMLSVLLITQQAHEHANTTMNLTVCEWTGLMTKPGTTCF